jgi:hypothetical protein
MQIKAIVTNVMSYDVSMGETMLYPMGLTYEKEIMSYSLGWQSRDGKIIHHLIHFIGKKPLSQNNMMPRLASLFGIVSFRGEFLECKLVQTIIHHNKAPRDGNDYDHF